MQHGPDSNDYAGYSIKREKNKEWFKNYKTVFENTNVINSWIKHNIEEFENFILDLVFAYNQISKRTLSNPIYLNDSFKQKIENIKKVKSVSK